MIQYFSLSPRMIFLLISFANLPNEQKTKLLRTMPNFDLGAQNTYKGLFDIPMEILKFWYGIILNDIRNRENLCWFPRNIYSTGHKQINSGKCFLWKVKILPPQKISEFYNFKGIIICVVSLAKRHWQ